MKFIGKDIDTSAEVLSNPDKVRAMIEKISIGSTISNLIKHSDPMRPFVSVSNEDSMVDVINIMKGGAPIVPVLSSDGELHQVISRLDILRELVQNEQHENEYSGVLNKTLSELGNPFLVSNHTFLVSPGSLVTVYDSDPVLKVLQVMARHNLSGVPVISKETNGLVNSIDGVDLRLLIGGLIDDDLIGVDGMDQLVSLLMMNVADFLKELRSVSFRIQIISRKLEIPLPYTNFCYQSATPSSKLGDVIRYLIEKKKHRMYVTSDATPSGTTEGKHSQLLGVMSSADIMNQIF